MSGNINKAPIPLPVSRVLKKFGSDLSLARRRRRFSQQSMAERIGISVSSLRRLEKGDPTLSRIIVTDDSPVAVIRRFDRTNNGCRIPYLSAASMLQARRDEERAYTEIAEHIISISAEPKHELAELWRRIVFNLLITNVDDHLHSHGFLHVANGHWSLAPAFDLNPFPDKDQELKTWLTEETGPASSITEVMRVADHFWLEPALQLVWSLTT